ncbi:MAG: LD-carboxypeptidase [Ignavibacteria bacterium]|nr:LD-carboxypeptidase [Ignavibacteria bacterium]
MKIIKPPHLKKGDLIGLISPASTPDNLERINEGVKYFERLGYRVIVGKNVGRYRGYLAGTDEERLEDLHSMFSNKEVKAIFCVRGGYGSIRLLDKIDYNLIKRNPKIFVGYSDITSLQLAIFHKTGLVSFSGPMAAVDFAGEVNSFTEEVFWRMVTSTKPFGKLKNPESDRICCLTSGEAKGILLGGNLSLVVSLLGTPFLPKFDKAILFLEEIEEKPYRIDRFFAQMKLAKIFDKVSGIILCSFTDCEETDPNKKSLSLNDVVGDYFEKLKKPVFYNLIYGHVNPKNTIPIGIRAAIDCKKCSVEITEACVT